MAASPFRNSLPLVWLVVCGGLLAGGRPLAVQAESPARRPRCGCRDAEEIRWLEERPCGPDSMTGPLRWLIPQGFAGADFRPACRGHDRCYACQGGDKRACDREFFAELRCRCEASRHPCLCRMVARLMHGCVRLGGKDAFSQAQAKSAARASLR